MNSTLPQLQRLRVRIFVDFWNFQLSVRRQEENFKIDWRKIGPILTSEVGKLVDPSTSMAFEAMHVYGSYDPAKSKDAKLRNWFTNTLDKVPGVHVVLLERQQKKGYPKCPICYEEIVKCQKCSADLRGTEE